ncbi:MAG: hypothetical protein BroJett011_03990 [Chloroflexota bacterium]|nr:MAG: hypothetical protein BroJett011_03990 [Chloroflexota bacterium]
MAAERVKIEYSVDVREMFSFVRAYPQRLTDVLLDALDELMEAAELIQVKKYTATTDPAPPAGSEYERTFTLQRASQTRRIHETLPNIEGEWYLAEEEAPYGKYVVGPWADQAKIHRRRWKSTGQVEKQIKQIAPGLIQQKVDSIEGPTQ